MPDMKPVIHSLVSEGYPFDENSNPISHPIGVRATTGVGRGLCNCGMLSDVLSSTAARKRWHREHKKTMLEQTDD